jgi:hypothetical protein
MDLFQTFPAPITEYTLTFLADLHTLHSLHNASPTMFSLLHEEGVLPPVIETILMHNYAKQIQFLLRTLTLLHWRRKARRRGHEGGR